MSTAGRIKAGPTDKAELLALFVVEVKQSLEDQSDNAQQLIASVLASYDIVQIRKNLYPEYDESAIEALLNPSIWKIVREQLISHLGDYYATNATGDVTAGTTKYRPVIERLIQSERKKFGGTQAITGFFYCFARAFVDHFLKSAAVPDVEGMDDEVVAGIIDRKHPMENKTLDEFGDGASDTEVVKVAYANMVEWLAARDCEFEEILTRTYNDPRYDSSSESSSELEEDDSSSDSAGSDSDEST
jgi:hypothetical protein